MTINIQNAKLIDGNFTENELWGEKVFENEGSFDSTDESMIFDIDGIDLYVGFNLSVDAEIKYDSGDYFVPSYIEAVINSYDIEIKEILLDKHKVDLDSTTYDKIKKLIEQELS